ncbi:MAG: stage II sporulation protein P [Coprococcus sp.]|nr:stage II sporulation protein P [Coprococcus sp.]
MITGLLICMLGICAVAERSGRLWNNIKLQAFQEIQESAEQMYLPGIAYGEKKNEKISAKEWVVRMAVNLIPLGGYVSGMEQGELSVEDEATYEMLLKMEAEDENEVDANGNLIGKDESKETEQEVVQLDLSMENLSNFEFLTSNLYTIDSVTYVEEADLNAGELMSKDLSINKEEEGPKVLIFHTHSQEAFVDSDGSSDTSIVGIGDYLTELLTDKYHIPTLHHKGVYDLIDGKLDRSEAYELARPEITQILKENPSIEVVIDLHRDGVGESTHLVTDVNGKETAQIMFFNGMSRTRANGNLTGMENPYIQDNLAFSMQMKVAAEEKYPGFTRRIYLKGYKYNMDLAPKMLLIEAGAQTNTVQEMKNAMEPLAELLDEVLS